LILVHSNFKINKIIIINNFNYQINFLKNVTCAPIISRQPYDTDFGGNFSGSFGGGIYSDKNIFIPIGVERYGRECLLNGHPESIESASKNIDKAIFGGYLFQQFGHFIIESTARLWARHYFPDLPIIFIQHSHRSTLYAQQQELLNIFGNFYIISDEAIKVRELILPTPSLVMGSPIVVEANDLIRKYIKPYTKSEFSGKRIYLTRRNIAKRPCLNEVAFIGALEKLSIEIIAPEDLSFMQQVDLFSNAELVVGLLGSAWHSLLFANPQKNCKRIYLDFLDHWGDTYKFIEDISDGSFGRCKCLIKTEETSTINGYDAEYLIDIEMALNQIEIFIK
jgi:hypothetical protein